MNKLHMGMKRMLTGLLAASMIVTSVPAYAFAEEIQAGNDTAVVSEAGTDDAAVSEDNSEESVISTEEEETVTESQEETVSNEEESVTEEKIEPETEETETEAIAEDKAPEAELFGNDDNLYSMPGETYGFYYSVNDGKATLTETYGTVYPGHFKIPDSIEVPKSTVNPEDTISVPVTVIGEGLFEGFTVEVGELTIPSSITEIGKEAFYGAEGITGTLTIPNSVTRIGDKAFYGCSITELIIGSNVTTIGEDALNCSTLVKVVNNSSTEFTLPECEEGKKWVNTDGETITKIKNGTATLFDDNFTYEEKTDNTIKIIGYKKAAAGTLVIPNKIDGKEVTEIGKNAFRDCSGFTGALVIPDSVITIGESAFYNCNGFNGTLTLGSSLQTIGDYAFCGDSDSTPGEYKSCKFTGTLTIPAGVTTIGEGAFWGCTGLTGTLTIPSGAATIGAGAFRGCTGLTGDLTIPDSVTTLGDEAFMGCIGFTGNLKIGNGVTEIGEKAFYSDRNFNGTLTIGNSVETIGESAFDCCSGFKGSITIPDSVTTINYRAFAYDYNFDGTLTLGKNVEEIGDLAFIECYKLNGTLTIPNGVKRIGTSAFSTCYGFTGDLTIPNSVGEIGDRAFIGCNGLDGTLTISGSLLSIGNDVFIASQDPSDGKYSNLKTVVNNSEFNIKLPLIPEGKQWKTLRGEEISTIGRGTAVAVDSFVIADIGYAPIAPQTFTGKQIKPAMEVFYDGLTLKEKTDYTIKYSKNTNVGTATFTITAKGNYTGKETGTFEIVAKNIEDEDVTVSELASAAYNSKKDYKPVPVIKYNGKKLANKKDFTIEYYKDDGLTNPAVPRAPGMYYAKVTGIKNYTGYRRLSFVIAAEDKIPVSKLSVAKIPNQKYTGEQVSPKLTVKSGKTKLAQGTDYILTYGKNTDIGTGTVTIEPAPGSKYSGTRTVKFNITGRPMKKVTITGIPKSVVFDGSAKKFVFNLVYKENKNAGEEPVIWKTQDDYDELSDGEKQKVGCIVTLDMNAAVGKRTITFKGINGYSGTVKKTYKITPFVVTTAPANPEDPDPFTITLLREEYPYAQGGTKPEPTVRFGDKELVKGKDYTLSYANNTAVNDGSGNKNPTVKVTGKGNFKGTDKSTTFKIKKGYMMDAGVKVNVKDVVFQDKEGNWMTKVSVVGANGKALKAGKDYDKTIKYSLDPDGKMEINATDKIQADVRIYVTVNAAETSSYTGSATGSYRVVKTDIGKLTATLNPKTYTGSEVYIDPSDITWKAGGVQIDDVTFTIDATTYKNNIKKGKATVVVRGTKNYGGTKTITYTIGAKGLKWWWNNLKN